MKINFNCKDNDVKLKFITNEKGIDEIWVRTYKGEGWTIISYKNLEEGINKVNKKLKQK